MNRVSVLRCRRSLLVAAVAVTVAVSSARAAQRGDIRRHRPIVIPRNSCIGHLGLRPTRRLSQLRTQDASVGARAPAVAVQHRSPCRYGLERLN